MQVCSSLKCLIGDWRVLAFSWLFSLIKILLHADDEDKGYNHNESDQQDVCECSVIHELSLRQESRLFKYIIATVLFQFHEDTIEIGRCAFDATPELSQGGLKELTFPALYWHEWLRLRKKRFILRPLAAR